LCPVVRAPPACAARSAAVPCASRIAPAGTVPSRKRWWPAPAVRPRGTSSETGFPTRCRPARYRGRLAPGGSGRRERETQDRARRRQAVEPGSASPVHRPTGEGDPLRKEPPLRLEARFARLGAAAWGVGRLACSIHVNTRRIGETTGARRYVGRLSTSEQPNIVESARRRLWPRMADHEVAGAGVECQLVLLHRAMGAQSDRRPWS
jgi:hypothetical protein